MTSRKQPWITPGVAAVLSLGGFLFLAGCGGGDEPPAPAPQQARNYEPPPDPEPAVQPIDRLMADLSIDDRINLPDSLAPNSTEARRAILEFFDAMARSDAQSFGSMLSPLDRPELDEMTASGRWQKATEFIASIDIQTGTNEAGQNCVLAVIEDIDFKLQPQLWYYTIDSDGAEFESAPTPPGILDQLSGDWIAAWHRIIDEEMALAMEPDEDLTVEQTDLREGEDRGGVTSGRGIGGGGGGPGGRPPGVPGRRQPPSAPRRPPGSR